MFANMNVYVHATYCHFDVLYVNGNAKKWLLFMLNSTQYATPEQGGTQYARWGGGFHPHKASHFI